MKEAPNAGPRSLGLITELGVQPPAILLIPSTGSVPGTAREQDSPAAVLMELAVQPDGHLICADRGQQSEGRET